MLKVGLTGGIASGKSTVAAMLADLGVFTVDADRLARDAIEPGGSAHEEVVHRFGREILDGQGRIDRPRLAQLVFSDAATREALTAIVHPRVRAEANRLIEAHVVQGGSPLVVFDAALLVETGAYRDFDRLILVCCSRETQIRRLLRRDAMTLEQAEARIASQASLERKLAVADYVVDTERPKDETRRRVAQIHGRLVAELEREAGA